ncbi:MAG: serine/threonine-protein phosphatase [Actinomycetia bacterium]|nr:serine/threonine-protein phosphatase [Actinomycetes bacterium]
MISETVGRVQPWYRDRGVQVSTAFTVAVSVFNVVVADGGSQQVYGVLAVSPMLAAVLVQRAWRVFIAAVIAMAAFAIGSAYLDVSWDDSQLVRLTSLIVGVVVGFVAAQSRLNDASRLVAIGEVAKMAQRAIMRIDPPKAEGVDAAVRYVSASMEARIGGDAYEALLTPFGLRVLVADARGKGLPAVLSSAVAVGAFRQWAFVEADLGDLIGRMNTSVAREVDDADFVTALVAEFCDDQLRYVCAGHPQPVLLRNGSARELEVNPVPPLSLIPGDVTPEVSALRVRRDDLILMFSDGLTDSRNVRGDFFDVGDSLVRVAAHAASVEECADGILEELRDFVEDDLEDDVALVALRVTRFVEHLPDEVQNLSVN